jgi:hypothetical protein
MVLKQFMSFSPNIVPMARARENYRMIGRGKGESERGSKGAREQWNQGAREQGSKGPSD